MYLSDENYLEHDITSAIAIVSIYDGNFLVAVKKHDIINMPVDDSKTLDFVFDDIIGSYRCKVFVWDGFSNMNPLSEYYEKGD
ncbi:MAG: hypothetical protein GX066_04820 [Clostridiaceae bacterium]|nr:hypothetical protein [Clostridiaceae bacterium]